MKTIKVDLGPQHEEIVIVPIADVHLGDAHANWKKLRELVDAINAGYETFTILNGDLIDNAIKASVGDIYSAKLSPMEQMEEIIKILQPLADSGKILAITTGNHEARTYKHTGIDVSRHIAHRLGLEDRYAPENYVLFVSFGEPFATRPNRRFTYTIHGTHGSGGGGRLVGGKMNAVERMAGNVDADIYLHSHTHLPATFKQDYIRTDSRTKTIRQVTKLFVNTNAFLNYGGYGETFGFKPATISPVQIKLRPRAGDLFSTCEV
jgi:predicted MPP superfamily phosphohydrolase